MEGVLKSTNDGSKLSGGQISSGDLNKYKALPPIGESHASEKQLANSQSEECNFY